LCAFHDPHQLVVLCGIGRRFAGIRRTREVDAGVQRARQLDARLGLIWVSIWVSIASVTVARNVDRFLCVRRVADRRFRQLLIRQQ
jgi:hypothetical protein